MAKATDRRETQRFNIHLPIHFRISQRGETSRWATGVTCDMSSNGVTFRCRKPLPIGAHIEMTIEWPARQDPNAVELLATGFVIRSSASKAAVSMTAHRFRVDANAGEPMGAIA